MQNNKLEATQDPDDSLKGEENGHLGENFENMEEKPRESKH